MATIETYYALSDNGAQLKFDPKKYFIGWNNFGWEITLPVAINNVQEIDFSVMSGVTVENITSSFDGALRVFAYDESNNVVGNVSSSVINRGTELAISSVLGPMDVGGNVVKRITLLGPSNSGPNLLLNGVQDGITSYKVVTIIPISVTTRPINILVSIDHEVTGAVGYNITYEAQTGGEVTAVSGATTLQHNITGLVPETSYTIRMYADTGSGLELVGELSTTTLPNVVANYDVTDFQDVNGITDLSSLDSTSLSNIASLLPDLVDTGDVVSLTLVDKPELTSTSFVDIGGTLDITGINGVLLPFHTTSGTGQTASLTLSDSTTVPVTYNDQANTISIESVTYSVGDTLLLDQKVVKVFDLNGLVVLSVDEISPSILAPSFRNILSTISDFATPGTTYNVTYEGPTGGEMTAFSDVSTLSNEIIGLEPSTQYTIRSYANMNGVYQLVEESIITTLDNVASNYDKTNYQEGELFNLDDLTTNELSDISSVWNEVFDTGDVVDVPLESLPEFRGSFVNLGENLSIEDVRNVIVPFDAVNGIGQDVSLTLSDNATTVTVLYDETVNTITVGGIEYLPGQSFILDGKKVTVLDIQQTNGR